MTEWETGSTGAIDTVNAEPVRQPLTLEDVSQRINTICNDYVEQAQRVKASYEAAIDVLAAAVDASPDIDQSAVTSIVLGRVQAMMVDVQKAFG